MQDLGSPHTSVCLYAVPVRLLIKHVQMSRWRRISVCRTPVVCRCPATDVRVVTRLTNSVITGPDSSGYWGTSTNLFL